MKKQSFPVSFVFLSALFALGCGVFFSGLGCGNSNGASGPTTVVETPPAPTPLCTSPSAQGVTIKEPTAASLNGGHMDAQSVTITTATTATSIYFYVASGPASQGRFAIYLDNGSNSPGSLMIQTNPVFLTANSWNNISLPAPVYLGRKIILDRGTFSRELRDELFPPRRRGLLLWSRLCLERKCRLLSPLRDYPHNLYIISEYISTLSLRFRKRPFRKQGTSYNDGMMGPPFRVNGPVPG